MTTDPLFRTCSLIAASYGAELDPARHRGSRPEAILDPAGIRCRKVLLEGDWWRRDNGPLLLARADDGAPEALLRSRGSYRSSDGGGGRTRRVNARRAASYSPVGLCFSAPFGTGKKGRPDILRECLRALSPADGLLLAGSGLAVGLLGLALPLGMARLLGEALPYGLSGQFAAIGLALAGATISAALFQEIRTRTGLRIAQAVARRLDPALWDRLIRLPAGFFRSRPSGEILHAAGSLVRIRQQASELAVQSLLAGAFAPLALFLLFLWSPPLASAALLLLGAGTGLTLILARRGALACADIAAIDARILGTLVQAIRGIARIRLSDAGPMVAASWARDHRLRRERRKAQGLVATLSASLQSAWPALSLALLYGLYASPASGSLDLSGFMGFLSAFVILQSSLRQAAFSLSEIMESRPLRERFRPILETEPEIRAGRGESWRLEGKVEIRGLRFGYHGGPPVLDGLDLSVRSGEFLAVAGASGSGKSTLLRLLLGFEEPQAGSILYDGRDLARADRDALRRQLGTVLQDCRILPGTILDNIVGTALDADPSHAMEAARKAGLEADIQTMPMGLYTMLSEGGGTLSGGQRQRLLIARALVSRPRLLFLDEATSALDNATQDMVTRGLLGAGVTRIVIAHRLSTLAGADRIVVLRGGRIAESGTYRELLEAGGHFSELARHQLA